MENMNVIARKDFFAWYEWSIFLSFNDFQVWSTRSMKAFKVHGGLLILLVDLFVMKTFILDVFRIENTEYVRD